MSWRRKSSSTNRAILERWRLQCLVSSDLVLQIEYDVIVNDLLAMVFLGHPLKQFPRNVSTVWPARPYIIVVKHCKNPAKSPQWCFSDLKGRGWNLPGQWLQENQTNMTQSLPSAPSITTSHRISIIIVDPRSGVSD